MSEMSECQKGCMYVCKIILRFSEFSEIKMLPTYTLLDILMYYIYIIYTKNSITPVNRYNNTK